MNYLLFILFYSILFFFNYIFKYIFSLSYTIFLKNLNYIFYKNIKVSTLLKIYLNKKKTYKDKYWKKKINIKINIENKIYIYILFCYKSCINMLRQKKERI